MQRPKTKEDCYELRREEEGFHFFKIISPMQQHQRIMIPKKFIRSVGNKLSDVVVLEVPSSKEWEVELREDECQVWFQNGWQEFAEYHSICGWHFLFFRYDGSSRFSVVICDISGSEIEYPCDTEDLKEPRNEIGSPKSSEQGCSKHGTDEFNGRKTHKSCNMALPQPRLSLDSIASKKNDAITDCTPIEITDCTPTLGAIQEDASEKKRESTIVREKKRAQLEGNQESHLMLGKNAVNGILNNGFDENICAAKNMGAKQSSDSCVQEMEKQRELFCNKETDKIRLEECEVFGSIFNIESTWNVPDSDPQAKHKQPMSSLPGSQLIRSCNDDQHQVKNLGGMLESSDFQKNTVSSKRVDLDLNYAKQETRTTVFSIPEKRHVEHLSGNWRPLSVREKEEPALAAKSFTSENPFFSVTMRHTHISCCMVDLPTAFADAYLIEKIQPVTLQVSDGRMWQVNCSSTKHYCRLFKGWKEFVLDNHLVEDDICIFELLDKKHKKLKVSIVRVLENPKHQKRISTKSESPSGNASCIDKRKGKITEDHGKKRRFSHSLEKKRFEQIRDYEQAVASSPDSRLTRPSRDKLHQRMNMEGPLESYSEFLGRGVYSNIESNAKKIKTAQVYVNAESKTRELQVHGEKQKAEVEQRSPVPNQVQERPILAFNAFTSGNPFCTVTMRSSYVSKCYKLSLPVAFARTYLKDNIEPVTLQVPDGRTWQVNYSEYYSRLVKGWRKFVLDNHLEEDDTCNFELIQKKPCKLKVNIFHALKDPKQKNGFSQLKSTNDNPSCLVENEGKPDEDIEKKRKLPDLKENNRFEMGNEELDFIIDKNDALDLSNSDFQIIGAPTTSTSTRFTSSWADEKKRNDMKLLPSVDACDEAAADSDQTGQHIAEKS